MKQTTALAPALALRVAHGTRTGTARAENQDAVVVLPLTAPDGRGGMLCVVADGVGGLRHGATASAVAVQTVAAVYGPVLAIVGDPAEALRRSALAAHDAVRRATAGADGDAGGATTLVMAALHGGRVWTAHAGDSRAYLWWPDGTLEQVTRDHSWAAEQLAAGLLTREQVAVHPWRSMITRCLGGETAPDIDVAVCELAPGARLLLCTDGLYGAVSDAELRELLGLGPQDAVPALLRRADDRKAGDDATVCVVAAGDAPARPALIGPSHEDRTGVAHGVSEGAASLVAPAARPGRSRHVVKGLALAAGITLLAALAVAGGFAAVTAGRVTPGVSVAGASLGGLDTDAATAAVTSALTPAMVCPVTVQAGTETWVRTPAELGLWVDAPATVREAQAIGRRGAPGEQAAARAQALVQGAVVEPVVRVDAVTVLEAAEAMALAYARGAGLVTGSRVAVQAAALTITERLQQRDCAPIMLPVGPVTGALQPATAPTGTGTD